MNRKNDSRGVVAVNTLFPAALLSGFAMMVVLAAAMFGNYPNTFLGLSGNTTVRPSGAPTGATRMTITSQQYPVMLALQPNKSNHNVVELCLVFV